MLSNKSRAAFSLLELLLVMGLLAVGLVMSAGPLHTVWQSHQREKVRTQFIGMLYYAQTLALRHHAPVWVCPFNARGGCGDDWRAGQSVFVVPANQPPEYPDRVFPTVHGHVSWQGFLSSDKLIFLPTSIANNGKLRYCDQGEGFTWIINRVGRVRELKGCE